ncbi:MAG: NAD(+)/NADH kinase [Actinomycetota bacterium]|nr:NAD(+)/NADH kinase [Actinomycetota bacterium]MED6327551.1 NAD(+)/NADH kinase [Actinomycetota bacterium]MEE2958016.1 NAD(+)/NADH kinase [Actinomycetota bacterium]
MAAVLLVVHEERAEAVAQADSLATSLRADGNVVTRSDESSPADGLDAMAVDLVVSLGGDGSILRAVDLLDGEPVPVLGVNHGELGYLAAVEPDDAHDAVVRTLAGEHDLQERMMLRVEVWRSGSAKPDLVTHALNEAVVERAAGGQTVRVGVSLDGEPFASYAADGLIAATPTGSTAYAFSARGPIVDPLHRSIQLTPVSPHMLFDRTLVLDPDTEVGLEVLGRRAAACTVDGRRVADLAGGDRVACAASDRVARLVTFGDRGLRRLLSTRFGLADR